MTILNIIILAAGQGKRMHSALPKVLHPLGGKPLLEHLITTAQQLNPNKIFIVYGHAGEQIRQQLNHFPVEWIEQKEQLGTGHAVQQALPFLDDNARVLILVGDTPLIQKKTLEKFIAETPDNQFGIITVNFDFPNGLGRIIRNNNKIIAIVEDKDATDEQREIKEINTGLFLVPVQKIKSWLPKLQNHNVQKEFYLTDILAFAVAENISVHSIRPEFQYEVIGINDRLQLSTLEGIYQRRLANELMLNGVTILDPDRIDIRGELHPAQDVTIDINNLFIGKVSIGRNSYIGPNCVLKNVVIGENVIVKSHSVIENTEIADSCVIGPFAHLRPETKLEEEVHIGNFVELKKTTVAKGSKINHLSYIGDAIIGKDVNIGAGTITCNYDGVTKHQTVIKEGAFIGSDTQLVAPVVIGENAVIGAGSTVTKDAPAEQLTLTHELKQRVVTNWKKPKKK